MGSIFISYRRGDTEGQAGRLFDDIAAHFGKGSVFMDVEDIEPGRDFRQVIDQHVSSCNVLLAMVGKGWLDATDDEGRRRLDDPNDFVRLETASALRRDIPVIPVLVQGASMPKADSLPEDLRAFAYRNAVELTHPRWESDVQLLIKALSRYADDGGAHDRTVSPGRDSARPDEASGKVAIGGTNKAPRLNGVPWPMILVAALVAAAFATGGYIVYDNYRKSAVERIAAQQAEIERVAAQKAEMERIAAQKAADEQRRAVERNEAQRRAEEEKIAAARAEAERAAAERAAREERAAAERRAAARAASERERRAAAASANRVHSRGELAIAQTWAADLDEGRVSGQGADLWFEAVTATERYVTPRNGAKLCMVRGNGLPARETCVNSRLADTRISVDRLRQSPSVCVRTSSGRYAAFILMEPVGPSPGTLKIRFVCYE